MRFQSVLIILLALFAGAFGMFHSSIRGVATVDATTGEIIWVPVPDDSYWNSRIMKRICVFCRGHDRI
ncbi:hypothetical protein GCK32_020202 [Trichostrongylus colubriformis]|uniref:Uncharacterized protein n=1 Tax=Trichostrongylus colubriformis TaxID=6319 RepID=A0AAN8IUZ4_TRICO